MKIGKKKFHVFFPHLFGLVLACNFESESEIHTQKKIEMNFIFFFGAAIEIEIISDLFNIGFIKIGIRLLHADL